jgi:tetrahydromethanopterin S-methyltransferase subunit E
VYGVTTRWDGTTLVYMSVSYEFKITAQYIVIICFFVALGIASFIGQFFASKNFKSEDAGQRSESWFGYKTYIPVILISFCYIIGNGSIVLYFICLISIYLLYVLYKRSFKLDKKTWIIVACVLIAATVAYVMGFSLQDTLRKNYLNPRYDDYYAKILLNCVSNRMLL